MGRWSLPAESRLPTTCMLRTFHAEVYMTWSICAPRRDGRLVGQVPMAPPWLANPASVHWPKSAPVFALCGSKVSRVELKSPAMIVLAPVHCDASQLRSARQLRISLGRGDSACTAMMVGPFPSTGFAITVGSTLVLPALRSTEYAPREVLISIDVDFDFETRS